MTGVSTIKKKYPLGHVGYGPTFACPMHRQLVTSRYEREILEGTRKKTTQKTQVNKQYTFFLDQGAFKHYN